VIDLVILACLAAVHQWPLFTLQEIIVDGPAQWHSRALALVTTPPDSNLFRLDRGELERRLTIEFGSLAECRAKLVLPDMLSIRLTPAPLALWTEDRAAVGVDGRIIADPAAPREMAPVWRTREEGHSRLRQSRAFAAAASWAQVMEVDPEWAAVTSEWACDPDRGWVMIGADGQTQIVLGWCDLQPRAYDVAQLLTRSDSLAPGRYVIDARFGERRLIVRARAEEQQVLGQMSSTRTSKEVIMGGGDI
jgi:hypothetical protein